MARLSAFRQQIDIAKSQLQGPARQALMAAAARRAFVEAQAKNRAILGVDPPFRQFVDGSEGTPIESVRPGGTIVYLFGVGGATLTAAADETIALLLQLSPHRTGRYQDHHEPLVNGEPLGGNIEGAGVPFAETDIVSFVNLEPYARKIEKGLSAQAPNGVYEVAYAAIRARYGNLLNVSFAWEIYPGHEIGSGRHGGKPKTRSELRRAAAYPTITLSVR